MSNPLTQRAQDEHGFTLIELLTVILIIGVLAAIAIPSFISQKSKADDAAAKTQVGTGQTAFETVSTENNGSYASIKGPAPAELEAVEPALKDHSTANTHGGERRSRRLRNHLRSGWLQRQIHAQKRERHDHKVMLARIKRRLSCKRLMVGTATARRAHAGSHNGSDPRGRASRACPGRWPDGARRSWG